MSYVIAISLRGCRSVHHALRVLLGYIFGTACQRQPLRPVTLSTLATRAQRTQSRRRIGRCRASPPRSRPPSNGAVSMRARSSSAHTPREFPTRSQGPTEAGTDHHPFLHSGLVRCPQVARRADAQYPRHRQASTEGALSVFYSFPEGSGRRQLRCTRHPQGAPPADHPRLRDR